MEKILVVDDNKTLSKLLAKRIEEDSKMSVDVAHDFASAKNLIENHEKEYFLAVLDLNLPDAPNGEIVDFALANGLCVIVLTGSIDKTTKDIFIKKDIIDYVYKGNADDVNYIFSTIDRLNKNRKHKILVAEDSAPLRHGLQKILQNLQFQVFTANNGKEALEIVKENPDIKLVLTDYNMPEKTGLEVLKELRGRFNKDRLGVIAMTSPSEETSTAMFIKQGANDFIAKPFAKEEIICRVHNTIEAIENIEQIADIANKDFLTGCYNRRYFFAHAEEYKKQADARSENYALAMMDIDFFKKVNDTYGHDGGDRVLKALSENLKSLTKGSDIVSRFGGEEFCILLKNISHENAVRFFANLRAKVEAAKVELKENMVVKFTISIGMTLCDKEKSLQELIDLADSALYDAKNGGRNRVEIAF